MPADNHTHDHGSELSEMQLRVHALETILTEKGYVDPAALDQIVENVETRIGPHIGARIVARAWVDPEFKRHLIEDATAAANTMGGFDPVAAHLIAVENTPEVHNLVVCTLCSCYPASVLGLPPVWYKSAPYRSRAVIDPKGVLDEFGVTLPPKKRRYEFGTRPPRRVFSWCRCGRPAPRAGARSNWPRSSPETA